MKMVTFKNVSFAYEQQFVLQDVNFEITSGEFVGVIGPNGGGKSTLINLLLGFLKPFSGSIQLFGGDSQESMRQIGYVPQNLRFDKKFPISVMEVVLSGLLARLPFYGFYSQEDRALALSVIDKMRLADFINRPLGMLSGGQIQRALIARALVANPRLLILDEPTANVDQQAQQQIYTTLKSLAGSVTIVMVTHDLSAAVNLVDRVLCVQGRVTPYKAAEICEHFALGLYHTPLLVESPIMSKCCTLQVESEKREVQL